MKIVDKYICEICNKEYDNLIDADICEKQGIEKSLFKVGDIVYVKAGYGWYDGDKRWIINPKEKIKKNPKHGNCFGKCCTMAFYYVITTIDQDPSEPHRIRYHLYTNAMSGKEGYQEGYTRVDTHYTPELIKNPPKFVIRDSKKLIGKKTPWMI